MPTNQFLPFGTAGGAYVYNFATYSALPARLTGYPTGKLLKEALNSAIRQSCFVAAALSQWIVDIAAVSVNDDGVIANWEADFDAAFVARFGSLFGSGFKCYAGNPNGFVSGVQGVPGVSPPTLLWDTANNIIWVCSVTGNAAAAVWVEAGAAPGWPFWCGTAAGTGNAPVLTTPAQMTGLATGTAIAWKVLASNTGAVVVTVGAFGNKNLYKDGPAGPVPLVGGELIAGQLVSARYDGTQLQLTATEMGTAALANASSLTGVVVAQSGAATIGNIPVYLDVNGTVHDSGVAPGDLTNSANSVLYRLGQLM